MSSKIPITVVVPVKNEEKNLPRCLSRLNRFADVIVVDSDSTDGTLDIAKEYGASVLQFDWDGRYPKKRNWVLLNHQFKTDWVLFLDADEVVDDDFCEAARIAISSDEHKGYWLNYTNYFLDRKLKGGLPQRKLALFKTGSSLYERIEENSWSQLDMEIHEHPIIEGSVGEIVNVIEHHDYRGIARFVERHLDYAKWEAHRLILLKKASPAPGTTLTKRQRFKYSNIERWWYPWFYFFYVYIVKLGFRDGMAGLYYAFYKAWYFLTIRLMVAELQEEEKKS